MYLHNLPQNFCNSLSSPILYVSHQSLALFPGKPAAVLPLGMSELVTRKELNLYPVI